MCAHQRLRLARSEGPRQPRPARTTIKLPIYQLTNLPLALRAPVRETRIEPALLRVDHRPTRSAAFPSPTIDPQLLPRIQAARGADAPGARQRARPSQHVGAQ